MVVVGFAVLVGGLVFIQRVAPVGGAYIPVMLCFIVVMMVGGALVTSGVGVLWALARRGDDRG
ncbi:hypothetical protein DLJ54_09995 [Corynebacterium heidelbergense]|uniref:Uncharacterized protein n=1 Tax=Corynebacterium heidelbergense TaxID=2055947 RepID=A0A364V3C2_9CORY|nr:hypothetical protein DLJ54_09995 [Corynebacterium heidelbergense]